jgi:hypothetical protein
MGTNLSMASSPERRVFEARDLRDEHSSGVSWAAVIGGAFVAAAVSLIMLALGAGFGLSAVSPWSNVGASASAVGGAAIAWLIVNEVISCALGGYLAGRLRTKWVSVHTDEVYFRDTANGFLVWAVAVVMTVAFMASAASFMVGNAAQKEPSKDATDAGSYFVDRLFWADTPAAQPIDPAVRTEAGLLLANTLRPKDTSAADQAYLGKLVAAKTGLSPADADKRVAQVISEDQQAEDAARKTASHLLLWIFLALLIGAFCASYAATIGGRQRDHVKAI